MVMDEQAAKSVLQEVAAILGRHRISFWLDSGTLLAAVRDGKLIPWDNDIDLGMWENDVEVLLENGHALDELNQHGFQYYFLSDKFILERDNVPVNVTRYYPKEEAAIHEVLSYTSATSKLLKVFWWALSVHRHNGLCRSNLFRGHVLITHSLLALAKLLPRKHRIGLADLLRHASVKLGGDWTVKAIPASFFTRLDDIHFYGERYAAPAPIEDYLVFRYGKDWTRPKQAWNMLEEDGAVVRDSVVDCGRGA